MQDIFQIGNFYVFQTGEKKYHAICIDALTAKDAYDIVHASGCDRAFKNAVLINEHRTWILRIDEKGNRPAPKSLCTVESPYEGQNPQSLGHSLFLKKFGLEIELKNPIGEPRVGLQGYMTSD